MARYEKHALLNSQENRSRTFLPSARLRLFHECGQCDANGYIGPMSCEEKTRLGIEYEAATSKFSDAVKELRRRMGTSPKDEYDRLERASNEARVRSEQARLALEQHVASHGC
jgi:hypothetical protein